MKELFHNCLEVEKRNEWWLPLRFSRPQRHYFLLDEKLHARTLNTAGIYMRFRTEAAEISFRYQAGYLSMDDNRIDLYENGALCMGQNIRPESLNGTFTYQRQTVGQSEFSVCLPALCSLAVSDFRAGNWQPVPKRRLALITYGDSITQGVHAKSPSLVYGAQIAERKGLALVNQALSGHVFDAGWIRPIPVEPAAITIAYGTNDFTRVGNQCTIEKNAGKFFKKLRRLWPQAPAYYLSPLWRADLTGRQQLEFEALCVALEELAASHGITPVSGLSVLPHDTNWMRDGYLHPNDAGYTLLTEALLKVMDAL